MHHHSDPGNPSSLYIVKALPVEFRSAVEHKDFPVVDRCPYDLLIGRPRMRQMNGCLDLGAAVYKFDHNGERISIPLSPEYDRPERTLGEDTDSEDFISDSDAGKAAAQGESSDEEGEEEDEFVIMHMKELEQEPLQKTKEEILVRESSTSRRRPVAN